MLTVVFWKEWRQQGLLFVAILVLAGVALLSAALTLPQEWAMLHMQHGLRSSLLFALMTLIVSQGVVTGAILFAGEAEEGTLTYLDQHSGLRKPVWQAKMIAGLSIVMAAALVLGGLLIGLRIASPYWLFFCVWFGIDTLLWATVCSAASSGTFRAIGVTALVLIAVSGLPLGWLTEDATIPIYFMIKVPLLGFAVFLSRRRFCASDRQRLRYEPGQPRRPWLPAWVRVSLWMVWARSGSGLATGMVIIVLASIATARMPVVLAWPILALFIGCICGVACFADDPGAERFLGDQRLPRGRLWLGKVVPWFCLGIIGYCLSLIVWGFAGGSASVGFTPFPFLMWMNLPGVVAIYVLALGLQGFALGQFVAQWTTKLPVGIFLSFFASGLVGAAWYPSLHAFMNPWPVYALAFALLAGTRLNLGPWTSGRLHDWSGLAQLACWVVLVPAWIAVNLWWRVAEVPQVGEPFDTRAFRAELGDREANQAGEALRESTRLMEERVHEAEMILRGGPEGAEGAPAAAAPAVPGVPPPLAGIAPPPGGIEVDEDPPAAVPLRFDQGFDQWARHILHDGYPEKPGKIPEFLDHVFAGNWVGPFKEAALAPKVQVSQALGTAYPVVTGGELFLLRALALQRQGKTAAALADLEVALATARHCLHRTFGRVLTEGNALHQECLRVVELLAHASAADKTLWSGLSEVLGRHEARMPDFADDVKLAYIQLVPYESRAKVPWERARDDRIVRAMMAGLIQQAERGVYVLDPREVGYFGLPPIEGSTPLLSPDGWQRLIGNWANADQVYENYHSVLVVAMQRIAHGSNMSTLHGLRLALAAAQRHAETGRAAAALSHLVPQYFVRLPLSPFGEPGFQYRVSPGEEVHDGNEWHKVAPGQGVITAYPNLTFVVPMKQEKR